jgi:hypothetical protein
MGETVTRENADRLYQAMWGRAPKRKPDMTYTTPWDDLLVEMIPHCDAAALLYTADNPDDEYRRCMWQYRAHLHRTGWHDKVWKGEDPVVKMAAINSGVTPNYLRPESRQPTGKDKHRDEHRLGAKNAAKR